MLNHKIPSEDEMSKYKTQDAERRRRPADLTEAFERGVDPITLVEAPLGKFYSMKDKIPTPKR